jgi:hypothetical protein
MSPLRYQHWTDSRGGFSEAARSRFFSLMAYMYSIDGAIDGAIQDIL